MPNQKTCTKCKETKSLDEYANHPTSKDLKHSWCKSCVKVANKKWRDKQKATPKYKQRKKRWRTKKFANNMRHAAAHIARAKRENPDGRIDLDITLRRLYYRDQGICQLCKERVTPSQASMDHKLPYKRGGTHTWDNVQLTHYKCNLKKGDR